MGSGGVARGTRGSPGMSPKMGSEIELAVAADIDGARGDEGLLETQDCSSLAADAFPLSDV